MAVTIGLIAWRGDRLRSPGRIDSPLSREGAFLANNVLFAAFAFVVLLGTVFPLLVEAINGNRISVGVAVLQPHDHADRPSPCCSSWPSPRCCRGARPAASCCATGCSGRRGSARPSVVVGVLAGQRGLAPLLAFGLAGFAAGSAGRQLVLATRRQGWRGLVGRANGGMIVHIGVVIIAVAFAASSSNVQPGGAHAQARARPPPSTATRSPTSA